MDINNEHLGIPELDYTATATIPSVELQRICRDLGVIGDTCSVSCQTDSLTFRVADGDIGNGSITITTSYGTSTDGTSITLTKPVSMQFSLRYLAMFTKSTPLSASVTLCMTENMPVRVHYPIEGMGHLRFYLAPKIDCND